MVYDLKDCVALVVESVSGRWAKGTVSQSDGKAVTIRLRGRHELCAGQEAKVVFRTHEGQSFAMSKVLLADSRTLELVLTSRLDHSRARSDSRGNTPGLKAVCATGASMVRLKVLDMSNSGMRFEAERQLPADNELRTKIGVGSHNVELYFKVLRQELTRQGTWVGGGEFPLHCRMEVDRIRHLIHGNRSSGGNMVHAVGLGGAEDLVATVVEIQSDTCTVGLRGRQALRADQLYALAFRTATGMCTCFARSIAIGTDSLTFKFLTKLNHSQVRKGSRKSVHQVRGLIKTDERLLDLQVVDISESGIRFRSHAPCPTTGEFRLQLCFGATTADLTCQIVRQDQGVEGLWQGGLKFCGQSRVDIARLKQHIVEAA